MPDAGNTQAVAPYDPNVDAKHMMFPSTEGLFEYAGGGVVTSAEAYASMFTKSMEAGLAKAMNAAPQMFTFGAISYMPDGYDSNLLQWPGISPESLLKIARENIAPHMIIGMRCDDVARYSQLSDQIWRPGWCIEPRYQMDEIPAGMKRDIREAELFIQNCNIETGSTGARKRDAKNISNFQTFLAGLTRDTLTVDQMAVWTDMDNGDRVKGFSLIPASRIRLVAPGKVFQQRPDVYAVAIDEGGTPKYAFTRDQLIFTRRNIRESTESVGYGYSEIEMSSRLIMGFQNAMDFNISVFDRNAIPNGMLVLKGETVTQKQLDLLNRLWSNMKKGITKAWTLPVLGLPGKDSSLELVNFNDVKGMEVYYQDFMNMAIGAFCTIYRFPIKRLGYRISGKGKDTEASGPEQDLVDESDPGLAPLLISIETLLNEYIVWSRWPLLRFNFNAKSPVEDSRSYEAKKLARTWSEERKEAGLPPLETLAGGDAKLKKIAQALGLAPADPAKDGVFQALISALMASKPAAGAAKPGGKDGARMTSKIDPARSEKHGGTAGVRRNSRAEKKK